MTIKEFAPKGEDVLRQEVITNYGLSEEEHSELIGKIVVDRLKDEQFKASEKQKTKKAREMLNAMTKGKDYYKGLAGDKPKGKDPKGEPTKNVQGLSEDEQFEVSYLAGKGYSKNDLAMMRKIQRVYKEDGKNITLDDARKTSLYKAFKANKEADEKRIKAQKGASHSGSPVSKGKVEPKTDGEKRFVEEIDQAVAQFNKNAPKK